MWILEALLVGISVLIWVFVGFSLKKQYRYATQLFDMLRYFPILVVLSLITFIIGIYIWLDIISTIMLTGVAGIFCSILFNHSTKWAADYKNTNYKQFLETVCTEQFSNRSFDDYTAGNLDPDRVNIFIRHDVDISLKRTLKIAEIEKTMGIYSMFFFRLHAEKYNFEDAIPVIKKLANEGFGVGLHYETLSIAKGNKKKAIELLENDLERFRKIVPITVVAAHGQKGYKNRSIWEDVEKNKLQISSAYDMKWDMYLSDAGGKRLTGNDGKYLFGRIYEAKPGQIVQVLIHPDWWN